MSLSFVKSAVLSSTDGISHNEETTINNSETASVRNNPSSSGTHKPLFEQLRANQEAQQSKDDEFQRSIRGMRALDEEDVAHLDAMEEQRREVECRVKSGIEREVALFHAAREDRGLVQTVVESNDDDIDGDSKDDTKKASSNEDEVKSVAAVAKKQIVPKFTIKKKRKRVDNNSQSKDDDNTVSKKANDAAESKKSNDDAGENINDEIKQTGATDAEKDEETKSNSVADLLGLGCYGSYSDSD